MDLVKVAFFATFICPLLIIQQQAGAAPLCQDLNSKCSDYDASYCVKYDHIKQQCPLTCNQCGTIYPSSPVTSMTSSHLIDATQSTMVVSQSLTPTQSTVSISQVLTQTQSSVGLSQGLLTSTPTKNTDVLRPSSVGLDSSKTQKVVRATASKTNFTQANLLITLGILWSYLIYWC